MDATPQTTLEVLMAARTEVERGWCAYGWQSRAGVCAVHAVDKHSDGNQRARFRAVELLALALPAEWHEEGDHGIRVGAFNDHDDTSKSDVLALYDRAINAEALTVAANADPSHVHAQAA